MAGTTGGHRDLAGLLLARERFTARCTRCSWHKTGPALEIIAAQREHALTHAEYRPFVRSRRKAQLSRELTESVTQKHRRARQREAETRYREEHREELRLRKRAERARKARAT